MARNILEGLSRSPIGTIKSSSLQPAIVTSLTQLDVVSLTSYDQLPTTTESETIIVPGVYLSQQPSPKAKTDAHRLSRGLETSSASRPPATRRRATTCPRKLPQLSAGATVPRAGGYTARAQSQFLRRHHRQAEPANAPCVCQLQSVARIPA